MENPGTSGNRVWHLARILRPFIFWLILVLVLYGIRTHKRLMERTRLDFSVSLSGQDVSYEAKATWDGNPAINHENISLGNHTFRITHPKAEPFSTNLFIWYGGQDFGEIQLKRATGTLHIESSPRATRLTVRSPEFSTNITGVSDTNLVVPTDRYQIQAEFPYSEEKTASIVYPNQMDIVRIAPQFGAIHIRSSHSNTTFQLVGKDNNVRLSGKLPVTISELPIGDYIVNAERLGETQTKTLWLAEDRTNDVFVEYQYGAVKLETEPAGAKVWDGNGNTVGKTPLTLQELRPGRWHFTLERDEYEPVAATLYVSANETNYFQTNLVNHYYADAMRSAREYFDDGQYNQASDSAREALKYLTGDTAAMSLQREATGMSHLYWGQKNRERGDLDLAIKELKTALESIPDNEKAKTLLADYTKQKNERIAAEQKRIEAEKKRQAELAEKERKRHEAELVERKAQENNRELHDFFNKYVSRAENSAQFATHELATTNAVATVAVAIRDELANGKPSFKIVDFDQTHLAFTLQARQLLGLGYRDCFIAGVQVRDGETRILFKVLEYDHLPEVRLLGGALTVNLRPDNDPNEAARFQQQMREGEPMVEKRIRRVIESDEGK